MVETTYSSINVIIHSGLAVVSYILVVPIYDVTGDI